MRFDFKSNGNSEKSNSEINLVSKLVDLNTQEFSRVSTSKSNVLNKKNHPDKSTSKENKKQVFKEGKTPLNLTTTQIEKNPLKEELCLSNKNYINHELKTTQKSPIDYENKNSSYDHDFKNRKEFFEMNEHTFKEDANSNEENSSDKSFPTKSEANNKDACESDSEYETFKKSRLSPVSDASDNEINKYQKIFKTPQDHVSSNGYFEFYFRLQKQQLEQQGNMQQHVFNNSKERFFPRELMGKKLMDRSSDDELNKNLHYNHPFHFSPHQRIPPLNPLHHASFDKVLV